MGKILVADDQLVMRNMFKTILAHTGHEVDYASNGEEAYEQAKKKRYDLVITDLYMPLLTGIELTRKLRSMPAYTGVPILVVSTENATNKKSEGKAAGANGWVVKPISSKKLLPAVEKLMH